MTNNGNTIICNKFDQLVSTISGDSLHKKINNVNNELINSCDEVSESRGLFVLK